MLDLHPEGPPHPDLPNEQAVSVLTFRLRIGEKDGHLLSGAFPCKNQSPYLTGRQILEETTN